MINKSFISALLTLEMVTVCPPAHSATEVAGISLADSATVQGVPLTLNGAGYRKLGYFRMDVTALYAERKISSFDELSKMGGTKRLEFVMLQDIPGNTASRHFLAAFEDAASRQEFVQLVTEVSQLGDIYSRISLKKGDVVTLDIIPQKGLLCTLNGSPLIPHGASSPYFTNPLLSAIVLRMYTQGKTPKELQDNLFGNSGSMQTHLQTTADVAGSTPPSLATGSRTSK